MESEISYPNIPCIKPVPSPLKPGNLVKIYGSVLESPTCFAINFQNGPTTDPKSDIALHLSPVFSPPSRVVRNSLQNDIWGPEESHGPYFPFLSGQQFEILILVESDHFKIAVNGQHFAEFHYRLPLSTISYIAIDGDVTISLIKFETVVESPIQAVKESDEVMSKPLGFVIDPSNPSNLSPSSPSGRPSSLPYPSNAMFGPMPTFSPTTDNPYGPPVNTYGPTSNPYGPPPQSGRVSPSPYGPLPGATSPYGLPPDITSPYGPPPVSNNPYGPSPVSNPYGPPPGSNNPYGPSGGYPQQQGAYPQGYPQQQGAYPQGYPQQSGTYPQGYPGSNQYPQPGPYPGTSVVYPGQEKKSEGGLFGPMAAAGAAALAGVAGSTLLGGKKHKKNKKHGMAGLPGANPASLISGVGSLLSGNKHGAKHPHSGGSSSFPMGGALAGGAAGLAGAYMLSKSPIGKMMKPKKMKKFHKGWGSSSSSSSSSD